MSKIIVSHSWVWDGDKLQCCDCPEVLYYHPKYSKPLIPEPVYIKYKRPLAPNSYKNWGF